MNDWKERLNSFGVLAFALAFLYVAVTKRSEGGLGDQGFMAFGVAFLCIQLLLVYAQLGRLEAKLRRDPPSGATPDKQA